MDVYLNENGGVSGRGERRCLLKCNQFFICYIQFLLSKRTPPEEVAFQNAPYKAEESPEKKTGIEFCDLLIALTNSMRSPLCLPVKYARLFSVML